MNVIIEDGSTATDIDTVLNKWITDFSSLFNISLSGSAVDSNHAHHVDTVHREFPFK